jgi:hypothetical protein
MKYLHPVMKIAPQRVSYVPEKLVANLVPKFERLSAIPIPQRYLGTSRKLLSG